ncbi:MAG TPA: ATP synthase subunit I [Acidimicrobiales bacterium]|nr:ATP synthase subunit I [Acidimicrobiales bacterium]
MFDKFSLPDLARVSRRTVMGALVIGIVGLVVCLLLNAALVGLGLCLGLALGILNFRMVQRAVVKVGDRSEENRRRPLALNTLGRLAFVSVIALGLLFLSFDLGLGVMGGLAVFEFLLLANVARSMMKMGGGLLTLGGDSVLGDIVGADALDEPHEGI